MRKQLFIGLCTLLTTAVVAQTNEWKNPEVNAVNRAPMHTNYFEYENKNTAIDGTKENSSNFMTLNGLWKFNWVKDADSRPIDFWKIGYNDKVGMS